ncbi:MAG: transglycosylase SLT domain-containing protein, partial [Thiovulaceae bacterium]|nr:transglycosylase SLT domain-containing protein [Sulfurimonadaceae bacterium]
MRILFIFLLPLFLYGNLTNFSNNNKEIALLKSFDIEPSFLYDPIMNNMRNKNNSVYKNNHFFKAMEEAYLFIPSIKQILVDNDIPLEFLYLVMAESNFSNKAYSKKRASGLWQFMPATGKLYGLTIDEYVDERRD